MTKQDEYRAKAEHCREMAGKVTSRLVQVYDAGVEVVGQPEQPGQAPFVS